jgi:DNA-binding transcriptional ArsR family regulator
MDPFPALAEPSRRRMVELLGAGERAAGAIASEFDLTPAAVSQHLKVLREAGLVRVRIDGPRRIYSLDPAGLAAVDSWLERVRAFWGGRLDALERALEKEKGEKK